MGDGDGGGCSYHYVAGVVFRHGERKRLVCSTGVGGYGGSDGSFSVGIHTTDTGAQCWGGGCHLSGICTSFRYLDVVTIGNGQSADVKGDGLGIAGKGIDSIHSFVGAVRHVFTSVAHCPIPMALTAIQPQQESVIVGIVIGYFPFIACCSRGTGCEQRACSWSVACSTHVGWCVSAGGTAQHDAQFVGVANEGILAGFCEFAAGAIVFEVRTRIFQFLAARFYTALISQFVPRGRLPGIGIVAARWKDWRDGLEGCVLHSVAYIDIGAHHLGILGNFLCECSVLIEIRKRTVFALQR